MRKTILASMLLVIFSLTACSSDPMVSVMAQRRVLPETPVNGKWEAESSTDPSAYYHFLSSQLLLKEGKLDQAIQELRQAIRYDEEEPILHVELATLYIHKGLLDEAVKECEVALSFDPDDEAAHLMLGAIYTSLRKNDLAIESYKK